jgi:hypothetical protein
MNSLVTPLSLRLIISVNRVIFSHGTGVFVTAHGNHTFCIWGIYPHLVEIDEDYSINYSRT